MASRPHLSIDPLPIQRWIMAPERRSNAAGPDTETSVQKGWTRQTNDTDIGKWRAMLERERDRWEERESLLGLIASSLYRGDKQKDYGVHFSRVTLFLPDFIPGTDQWIDYGLDMRADCESGRYRILLLTSWCDSHLKWCLTLPIIHILFALHRQNVAEEGLWRSAFNTSGHVFNLKEIRFWITLSEDKQGLLAWVCWLHRLLSLILRFKLV